MRRIGVGLASYGMSGEVFHAPLLSVNPGFEIISILERTKSLSRERYPEVKIIRHYHEMLNDDSVELVVVNTPDRLHYEMARQALEAGKHVILEKPFTLDSREGEKLIGIANERERLLSVFQNRRWDGDFLTVREILDKGLLGRLVEYEAHFDRYRNFIQQNTWKEEPESGTGTIFNLGSHLIDQALVLFGKPEYINADIRVQRTSGKVDDAFTLWLGYRDVKVTIKASYLVREPGPRYLLHGTEGSFLKHGIDPQEEALKKGELPGGPDWGEESLEEWGRLNTAIGEHNGPYRTLPGNYPAYYQNIHETLTGKAKLAVTANEANLVIRVIEAAIESSKSGNRVNIIG